MKRNLILIVLFLSVMNGKGQVWCYPGAEWYYTRSSIYGEGYAKLTYDGNEIFHNKNCERIHYFSEQYVFTSNSVQTFTLNYYTYTDNNVVYQFHSFIGEFDTLVNYNGVPGDSWYFPEDEDCGIMKCEVVDTGHTVIQGVNLKWLKIQYNGGVMDYAFERIGSTIYYTLSLVQACNSDNPLGGSLRCYSDNQIINYKTYSKDCNYISEAIGINEYLFDPSPKAYPNPVKDKLKIRSKSNSIESVSITNVLGEIIYESPQPSNEIDMSSFSSGIYFLNLQVGERNKAVKIIKE